MAAAEPASRPGDNFNALAIFAVLIVLYGIGYILTGGLAPGLWNQPFFQIGVHLLFAIGGFRLAERHGRGDGWRVLLGRGSLRLLPPLFAAVCCTVLVIGPLATQWPVRHYLLNGMTLRYMGNAVMIQQRALPGVFEGQQWGGSVNPMLWALLGGSLLALSVPLVAALPARLRLWLLPAAAAALGCLHLYVLLPYPEGSFQALRIDLRALAAEAPFFLMGVFWWHRERAGPRPWRADLAMLAFLANWLAVAWWDAAMPLLLWLTLPYMAACFGRGAAPLLCRLPPIATGMYLLGFPLQQLIVARWPDLAHPIVACCIAAVLYGLLSWFLVERPALRRGWRGLRPWRWRQGGANRLRPGLAGSPGPGLPTPGLNTPDPVP